MKLLKLCCAGVLLWTSAAPLHAALSFQSLLDGQTITAGDKLFSNFRVDFLKYVGTGVSAPDYSLITVDALNDGGLNPGPGLRFDFNDQMRVAGVTEGGNPELLEYIDLTWSFYVTVLAPKQYIVGNLLALDAELTQPTLDLGVFVREDVLGPPFTGSPVATTTAELSFLLGSGTVDLPTDIASFGPYRSMLVTKNLLVQASVNGEVANAISVTQRFPQQVPVPASGLLLLLGLAGLALTRRRSRG